MSNKRKYLTALMQQSPEWVKTSMDNPNKYMTRMDLLLHAVALRKMGY